MENISNCCGARTTEPDKDGLAKCKECWENCTVEDNQEKYDI